MEIRRREQAITRFRPPGVIPLELWDLWVGNRILWDAMQESIFPEILRDALIELQHGGGTTRSEGSVPASIAGFEAIFVAGGRSREPRIRSALDDLKLPVFFSATPENPGRNAALHLLAGRNSVAPWVCDLGQASFKLCSNSASARFHRDLQRLPIRKDNAADKIHEQRQALRWWMTESMQTFAETTAPPDALIFALPSRLDDSGIPDGSSYIGMGGDASLIPDVIKASGFDLNCALMVNDAELAALDALSEPALQPSAKTLVITLGFGLGAALVMGDRKDAHA